MMEPQTSCPRSDPNPVILGLDPGLQATGWGIIALRKNGEIQHIANGTIRTEPQHELAPRLLHIAENLAAIIGHEQPNEAAVESALIGKGVQAALKLGHARAACLIALARAAIHAAEYPPTTIKKAITGNGAAEKNQIRFMIQRILPRAKPASDHAADALAAAICHVQRRNSRTPI